MLSDSGDVRIAKFHCACEANSADDSYFWHPDDKLEYRAPEDADGLFSFASDIFSVAVTLFEMATGLPPDPILGRDELMSSITDPAKRELISFALHDDPSKRPTAEELLRKIMSLAPSVTSGQELTFRKSVGDKAPWGLDAPETTNFLQERWVVSEKASADEQEKRRALLMQLSDTDGFELMTKCTSETDQPPFVKITHTKSGERIHDLERAEQLTTFLQTQAGLTFFYQLFCASSSSVSPLLNYEWVRFIGCSESSSVAIVRKRVVSGGEECGLKFFSVTDKRGELEIKTHAKVADTEFVKAVYHYGSCSDFVMFEIREWAANKLKDRIHSGVGIEDSAEFWRLAFQLARAVVDIHSRGILHLALRVSARETRFVQHSLVLVPVFVHSRKTCSSPRRATCVWASSIVRARRPPLIRTLRSGMPRTGSSTVHRRTPTARSASRRTSSPLPSRCSRWRRAACRIRASTATSS